MSDTFGKRLRRARKDARLTGPELAKRLDVSAQTVSEWERGLYLPAADRLAAIARLVGVKVDWLLTGQDGPILGALSGTGRLVPKVAAQELPGYDPRDNRLTTIAREQVLSHFPCGPHAFQITIGDNANSDTFSVGDSVIIDPDRKPVPGSMVLAVVDGAPLFRRYRPRGSSVELVPLNADWETTTATLENGNRLLGTMTEHARKV